MKKKRCILSLAIVLIMTAVTAVPGFAESKQTGQDKSEAALSGVQQVEGEYLIQYKEDIADKTDVVESELPQYDTSVVEAVMPDVQLIEADSDMTAKEEKAFIKELESLDEVAYVEPNVRVKLAKAASPKAVESYPQWGLEKIKAPAAWNKLGTAAGRVTVAVVDTGVDATHPDLQGRVKQGKTLVKRNSKGTVYNPAKAEDDEGHGTQSAGIIAANAGNNLGIDGAAGPYDVDILPVKAIDDQGYGTMADIIKGIEYAADRKADVISMSLGFYTYSVFLEKAVQYAQQKGCVIVAAAGNEAEEAAMMEKEYGVKLGISFPAALDGVLAVGATKKDNSRASFSNYGEGLDLMAPGLFIMSTLPAKIAKSANEEEIGEIYGNAESGYYLKFSGTSAAVPHVSAVAALYKLKNPQASGTEITSHLKRTARDLGKAGYDIYTGYGMVDAENALTVNKVSAPGRSAVSLKNKGLRSISVSWTAASGADGYDVYRAAGIFGEYKKVRTITTGSRSFLDSGLKTDTNYCYKVSPYKKAGNSKVYGIASTPVFCATSALYVNVKASAQSYKSVKLTWNKSKKAKGYVVYRASSKKGNYKKIAQVKSRTNNFYDKKAVVGKTYYYRVKAYLTENGKKVYSDASNTVSKKTTLKRPAVSLKKQGSKIQVSWKKVAGAQGYQVYRADQKKGPYKKVKTIKKGSMTSYTSGKLKNGKRYYYKVRAYRNTAGKRGYSSFSTIKSKKM